MQFSTLLLPYKKCVIEKKTYVNKECNLLNPYLLTVLLTIPLINYPAPKDKKKQKKKPIKKVLTSNPSTLIETSQQQVAFSNNRLQPRRARRRSDRVSDPRRSDLTTIDELGSNHNQNNNSAGGRTQNLSRLEYQLLVEDNIERFRHELSRGVSDLSRGALRSEMSRGVSDLSRGALSSEMSRGISDLSRGVSDLSDIGEDSNPNQNNNSAGGRTQNLGMHTIVEEDIRRLRGNGNDLWDLNPATVREIIQLTQPQGDVTVIPIENDTNTVTTSNGTNLIKCCKSFVKEGSCCIGLIFVAVLVTILMIAGLAEYKRKEYIKVSISTNDSISSNDLRDDYDNHYDIAPQKVR